MIKFWKSAAKGKTGCPVRPPETSNAVNSNATLTYDLEKICDEESFELSTKKSRLSKTLLDTLQDKSSLAYFIQYLDSTSSVHLIKFWLDAEYFKSAALQLNNFESIAQSGNCNKIIRATSFESPVTESEKLLSGERGLTKCPETNCDKKDHTIVDSEETQKICSGNVEKIKVEFKKKLVKSSSLSIDKRDLKKVSWSNLSTYYTRDTAHNTSTNDDIDNNNKKAVLDDAISIFKKYIALESPYKLDLPDNIRNMIISNICHPEGLVDVDSFKIAQEIVYEKMETNYFKAFLSSPFYKKYQVDILTSGSLTLEDILYNDMALFYFMEFLEQESCSTLMEFLMAVMHYSENLEQSEIRDPELEQNDAIVLYNKYFSLQATDPIGFSDDVRFLVEENICKDEGPAADCFHKPFRIVAKTLTKYVNLFLASELYYKYLSEMINSVEQSWQPVKRHKKSLSDCSSEISISTQNTLLAMSDLPFREKQKKTRVPDMTIDSNQLYNADSLWQRKKQDGLNLGRINSLGRFESKLDPDPDKKDRSVIKKMVSRFVPSTAAHVEEEMAWQVAHMIVKDITDLTMTPPESHS